MNTQSFLQRMAPWLVGPAALLGLGLSFGLLVAPGEGSPSLAGLRTVAGGLFVLPLLWIITSALWPARADRTCPRCESQALRRLGRGSTRGLVCDRCDYRDAAASAWFLAEEEGPLEELVLEQRARKSRTTGSRTRRRRRHAPVDSVGGSD